MQTAGCDVLRKQLPHHGLQDAAVFVVVELDRRVDADVGFERLDAAIRCRGLDSDLAPRLQVVAQANDFVGLLAGQAERFPGLPLEELEWQDAHVYEIAPVNALEALSDDRSHAEEHRPL